MYTFGAGSAISKKPLAPWYDAMLSIQIFKKISSPYSVEVIVYVSVCFIFDHATTKRKEDLMYTL